MIDQSSGVEYDRYVDPVIEWCTALEWSAVMAWHGRSSGSIFSGRFVLRLLPDCCEIMDCDGIGGIVIIVCVGAVVFLIAGGVRQCCFVIGLSVDLI